jgi:hypothetical protein
MKIPLGPTEQLLSEACELLQDCFRALGDRDGMKRVASRNLQEWWSEHRPKPRNHDLKELAKITIIDCSKNT